MPGFNAVGYHAVGAVRFAVVSGDVHTFTLAVTLSSLTLASFFYRPHEFSLSITLADVTLAAEVENDFWFPDEDPETDVWQEEVE